MAKQQKQIAFWLVVIVSVIILTGAIIWAMVKLKPTEHLDAWHYNHHQHLPLKPLTESTDEPKETDAESATISKMSLNNIIKATTTWQPAFTLWYGEMAPDFTLTDINGKEHKLSDYRGKNVLIIFWATWCRPCLMEIPHLIELRNTVSENELAMLAISQENPNLVKNFAAEINYTVLINLGYMSRPYSLVNSIPSSFFIDPKGKIKLATVGMLSLDEIKAILQAE